MYSDLPVSEIVAVFVSMSGSSTTQYREKTLMPSNAFATRYVENPSSGNGFKFSTYMLLPIESFRVRNKLEKLLIALSFDL